MRSLLLPACVPLRPRSVALLREIGVKIQTRKNGLGLEFSDGVSQVVSCVLETEKPFLATTDAVRCIDLLIIKIEDYTRGVRTFARQ